MILQVQLQPRASRNEWLGPQGDRVRIRLTAPPVDGQANRRLQQFLAELFRVPKSAVSLLAGQSSRYKRLCIHKPQQWPDDVAPPMSSHE